MVERTAVLEAVDIHKHFDGVKALAGVSFALGRGEILGVIGPNGSGKTTLLNVVTGVVRADSGTVRCGGTSWRWMPVHRIARMGIARTFQNIHLFEEMTVTEHVEVATANSASDLDSELKAAEVLKQLDLAGYADTVATTLPYGLQRRVELARALASDPVALLLDEPAAGLNRAETEVLHHDLLRLRAEHGCCLVLIDHDVRLIMRTCERVIVLNDGRVIAEGTPDEVRTDPAVIEAYLG